MKNIKYFFLLVFIFSFQWLDAQDKPGELPLQPLDDLTVYLSIASPDCAGVCDGYVEAVVMGGQPPYSYLWSNGLTTFDYPNACAGDISVLVTDAIGNHATDSIYLFEPTPLFFFITGLIIVQPTDGQNNGVIALDTSNIDTTGYFGDLLFSIDSIHFTPYRVFRNLGPGVYHICIIDTIVDCIMCAQNEITLYDITAVEDLDISFQLFPNPVATELHLHSDIPLEVELMDMNGRKIFSDHLANDHLIQMMDYPDGIYILKISDGLKSSFEKIVVASKE